MSKQDIEKRLGFAAQGVKETTRTSAKARFGRFSTEFGFLANQIKNQPDLAKKNIIVLAKKMGKEVDITRAEFEQLMQYAAKLGMETQVANAHDDVRPGFSRSGVKAKMGFLSRVGYAATALTADPADPKSPEYRKQVSEAKAAAKDAITNYKFMRDKVKERLAALDAYVTNAIKVINSATSAKDIEHYVEQLRIAVKSQSMILGASKSPFSRPGVKAKMSKATDALAFIKSSIESGKTVYIQTPLRATKVTPKTYAAWEASGRPLFKIGKSGELLMASGSSYNHLTMGGEEMLVRVSAMSRPGVKAKMAAEIASDPRDKDFEKLKTLKGVVHQGKGFYIIPGKLMTPERRTKVKRSTQRYELSNMGDLVGWGTNHPNVNDYRLKDWAEAFA